MKKFAFVFPGQGSQAVGMLDAWGDHPAVRQAVQEASDALGEDLGALIAQGPKEALALTTNTQPVMLLAGVAAWRVWQAEGGALPDAVAGHSLGEYSALVAAGVLSLGQAIPLVRLRAAAMQAAVPVGVGAMAAVLGLDAEKVKAVCAQVTADLGGAEVVEAVNFNDPGQTVIAGSKAAVDAAGAAMKTAGAKRALPLPVSAPFHSSLMQPAAEQLKAALAGITFAAPQIDVINNIDVAVVHEGAAIADALYRQAFGPVRWVESVQALKARGITHVVECGPGKVLAGMVKRIDADLIGAALYDPATLAEVKELLA
ncbi:ACP S-malonyltransferase [Comamonas denitrificans]|jgi:[acyl-carrier-protein] S-malonyltransferase|uniref:Malonyl CoA-acyl carrier protein transacylase n=1 Tax=Comamonas denitrificans TaxID=117506 RepID=A0A939GVS1_9BURK|nr:ACP S-malonyltransferase [Comamonas denitrificans]MBP6258931.1 ACP S-malonyltransferase [Comamonas sp.]MBO1248241.1 ACP S-malonyltransferase [Comamonas denitrificans]MBP6293009.1 ACP S-malonyltransferase [Comamonas sp.]MBP7931636.1 ACP S-malonyltransferase [Comamonas sp.]MBP7940338.1 ACP S-malonyltransferase [Comamonas sp.]